MTLKDKIIFALAASGLILLSSFVILKMINEPQSQFLASLSNTNQSLNQPEAAQETEAKTGKANQKCQFETSFEPSESSLIFKEIAWMGDTDNPSNEWFSIEKIISGKLDISGYQIVNQNQKIEIILPSSTILSDQKPRYVLARNENILGAKADMIYSGTIKNTDEGLRLFDNNCRLLDQVFAKPNWPAGSNSLKETLKRNISNMTWFDNSGASKTATDEKNLKDSADQQNKKENQAAFQQKISANQLTNVSNVNNPDVSQITAESDKILLPSPKSTESSPNVLDESQKSSSPQQFEPEVSSNPALPVLAPLAPTQLQQNQSSRVLIMEVMAGLEGNSGYEFIVLYNAGSSDANLSSWTLKKKSSTGKESSLVVALRLEGKIIPANSYFLLANEEGYNGNVAADVFWPPSYNFAYKNNAVTLYDSNGTAVDSAAWNEIPAGKSFSRVSTESQDFSIQDNPSPKNLLSK